MSWRKWLVRGLVFSIAGAVACAALLYQRWTNPVAIRQQVLEKLRELFPGATVTLDSARLDILGGIPFTELRLVRRDDPDRTEIAYVPSGVLYHNKQEVLDGKVSFRKIELERLRLRVVRGKDGRWNLEGLIARTQAGEPLPTVVVHQATLLLDDQSGPPGMLPVEIHNVNLTLVNDPLATVLFEGAGISDMVGALEVHGSWQRDTHEIALEAKALGVPLTSMLVRRAAPSCPDLPVEGLQIDGKADFEADIAYHPQYPQPLRYDLRCQLQQVSLQHPQLIPLPLEKLDASLRCTNGKLMLERLTARSGQAEVQAHGSARLPCPARDFEGTVTVKHLAVCSELITRLPRKFKILHDRFNPSGPVGMTFQCARQGGLWKQQHCVLEPEGASVRFDKFPYPLKGLRGTVDLDLLENFHKIDLVAFAGTRPVSLQGTWKDSDSDADVKLVIQANDILIDENLLSALPQAPSDVQKLARSFHPTGRGDCRVLVRHTPGAPASEFADEYHVQFRDATARWAEFPYPLEAVSGVLDVYPRHWEFSGFQGSHHGGTINLRGRSFPREAGQAQEGRMVIFIEGQNVNPDGDLRAALHSLQRMPYLGKSWDAFAPEGRMNFGARIDCSPGQAQDLDVDVDVSDCAIEPKFFPYVLTDLSGHFRYAHNRLTATKVSARHGGTRVSLSEGTVDLANDGGFYADLEALQAYPLFPDADLLKAMPPAMKSFVVGLGLRDPVVVKTRLVVSQDGEAPGPPVVYWDGQMWLRDARVQAGVEFEHVTGTAACVGRHDGRQIAELSGNLLLDQASCFRQPFRNLHASVLIDKKAPGVLLLKGLKAPLFGGDISGEARVEFNSMLRDELRYEMYLTASQIDLEQLAAHNLGPEPKLSGLAQGRLYLAGQGSGQDSLEGDGKIDVPDGKLIHLPLILDLLKFLNLRLPDRTAFQEMHAVFGIHGKRVSLSQLDLLGNPVSLSGNGGVNLDGTDIQMNFYSTWGRTEQLLPAVVRPVPAAISKTLLRIEVRGKVGSQPGDLQFTSKPVPVLTDPLLQMRDRMMGKTN